ncbi:hypothetical protein [Shinella sp. JR1-6]|uniref:hypothetical protein n=1 Tax=Shinella sp. JR1-6 TaxID=2527671 RepID=UPI00102D65E0|nr:hypothetical protein [Shinella sp. JR1-6]TAA53908.1 hypothetical protein EXZ48_28060 [Shinella sp. JR1-6]
MGQAFRNSANTAAYLKHFARQQEEERLRRDRKEDLTDDAGEVLDFALAVISASDANELRFELDLYGTGTVAALQQNEIELLEAREQVEKLLLKAHVMPDGRRVFKTEDGTRVFDEYGKELAEEVIRAEDIDGRSPRWETFSAARGRVDALESERAEIIAYQDKLDAARERLDSGEMTRKEFDDLRDELKADMPDAVRAQIPDMESTQKPDASADAGPAAETLDIPDDMEPVTLASRASAPAYGR